MPDFPLLLARPQLTVLSPFCTTSLLGDAIKAAGQTVGNAVWPAANRAIYIPVWVEVTAVAKTIALRVAVQSGNLDVGIYDEMGNRIVSKGSTAVAAAGQQNVDITASVTGTASPVLTPGTYFIAMSCDNVTASFTRISPAIQAQEIAGVQQQALGSVTLGATATFANPASAYVPAIAVTLVNATI